MKHNAEQIKQIIAEKVIGQITPEHTGDGHFYRFPDGTLQPSVTSKIGYVLNKPHLLKWACKMAIEWLEKDDRWRFLSVATMRNNYIQGATEAHTEIRDDAGLVGTQAHNTAEAYIKHWLKTGKQPENIKDFFPVIDGKIIADSRAIAAARGLETLFNKQAIIPLASEILVGDPLISAGTLDFLCFWSGSLTLVDFKTSNNLDDGSYSMQVAAYRKFFQHMTGLKISKVKLIHLSKDSDKVGVYNIKRVSEAYLAFKNVARIYDWLVDDRDKLEKDIKKVDLRSIEEFKSKIDWKHLIDKK